MAQTEIIFAPDLPEELANLGVHVSYAQVWMKLARKVVPSESKHRRLMVYRRHLPELAASLKHLSDRNCALTTAKSAR